MIPGENPKPSGKLNRAALCVATPERSIGLHDDQPEILNFFTNRNVIILSCAAEDRSDEKCMKACVKTDFLLAHGVNLLTLTAI